MSNKPLVICIKEYYHIEVGSKWSYEIEGNTSVKGFRIHSNMNNEPSFYISVKAFNDYFMSDGPAVEVLYIE